MGLNQTTEDGETPQSSEPVISVPPKFQTVGDPTIGNPWITGLFDCHEYQTNVEMVENLVLEDPWTMGLFDCHKHQLAAYHEPYAILGTELSLNIQKEINWKIKHLKINLSWFGLAKALSMSSWNSNSIAEILDEGEMTCPLGSFIYLLMMPALCSQWIMGSKYRAKLRKKYDLVDAPYEDKISHIFCPCCSLCQEFRELKSRGLDTALGWKGNLAQQQGRQYQDQQVETPPQNQTMF